jgi:hypothetical protein
MLQSKLERSIESACSKRAACWRSPCATRGEFALAAMYWEIADDSKRTKPSSSYTIPSVSGVVKIHRPGAYHTRHGSERVLCEIIGLLLAESLHINQNQLVRRLSLRQYDHHFLSERRHGVGVELEDHRGRRRLSG